MADVLALMDRVSRMSDLYRGLAGTLLARAQVLHRAGSLDDAAFASVRRSSDDLILQASDMLVELDEVLAQSLAAPLARVERATVELKAAETRIAAVTDVVEAALTIAAAAAAVAVFVAAPGLPNASAAVEAVAKAAKSVT